MWLAVAACTPDTSSSDEPVENPAVPSGTVAIPAERLTPFCEEMVALGERLLTDPPDDETAYIIESYHAIEDDVPAEISADFEAVLAGLEGRPIPTIDPDDTTLDAPESTPMIDSSTPIVTAPPATDASGSVVPQDTTSSDEGYIPSDEPVERLNEYVDLVCRDSQNNPGPPPTQPLDAVPVATLAP